MAKKVVKKLMCCLATLCLLLSTASADIEIHYLDVGQGDCAIIVADGEAMIIDGGSSSKSDKVFSYIRNTLNLESIKYMVATHPHEDHIGGLAGALIAVPVDLILSPVSEWDSKEFRSLIKYADMRESALEIPYDGESFSLGSGTITILLCWPEAEYYSSVNDMSIVLRVDYGSKSFLFTGDAEAYAEYTLVDAGSLSADVLKVGHHGSSTSSTMEFLEAVKPKYAIISCGRYNSYGHPRQETLNKLNSIGALVYRTDLQGTIVIYSNGVDLAVSTEKNVSTEDLCLAPDSILELPIGVFIGNLRTKKFHRPDCEWALNINERNRVIFENREEAVRFNYEPCKTCIP